MSYCTLITTFHQTQSNTRDNNIIKQKGPLHHERHKFPIISDNVQNVDNNKELIKYDIE